MTQTASRAFIAPEPFSPRSAVLEVAPGLTIAGILLNAVRAGELALEDLGRVAVYVDGLSLEETIEGGRPAMLDYVPPAGSILNLAVEVAGGGGGGEKNPLQTVLQIAIIVASFWVGGPTGPLAAASAFVRTAAAVAINVGGSYALSAAFGRDGDGMKEASDRRALEGASNQFRLREAVSLQLGRERVAADMAASPYTQNVGDDTFLHLALAWHYGEATLEDLKIGETLLADYPAADVQVEHFLTPGVPRESYLFPGSVRQENFSDQLDFAGGGVFEVHTAAEGAERIEVDITLPNGLKYNADSGKTRNEEVAGLIQYAEVGTEAWVGAPLGVVRDKNNVVLPAGSFYLNLRTNDAVRRTYGWQVPDPTKQYKVRVKAYDRDNDYPGEGRTWATYWTSLRALNRTRPIVDQNIATTFLRIRSSDDLNGALPTITGIVTPVVPIWAGGNWNTKAPTSNEAALARWLMTGPAAAKPLRVDQIDASIVAAYDLIEANGWGAAVQVRDDASQQDALIRLGRAGRFSTFWNGRKLCFVTDWEKPVPRQVFTGRNAEGYRYRRTFPDPIHAVIVEFRDPDSASVAGETIVYADGYTAANAELFETLRLDYSCTIARAFKEGRAYLAKRALLVESHEWTAGVDSIATTYGDRVLVRHWSNLYGEAEARVDYRHWQGGLVAGVRLDEPVTMVEGESYALDVRRADGVIRNLALTTVAGTSRTVTFAAPRAEDIAPVKGDLVVFGKLDLVTEDVEIIDVEPAGDMTATIRAVRYIGEELVLAETGPIPALVSGITPRPVAPRPRSTGSTGSPAGATVSFEVDPVRGALLDSTAVRWRRSAEEGQPENPWHTLPPLAASERIARTPPILDAVATAGDVGGEYRIDFELRTVLRNGSISDPEYVLDVLVAREVQLPVNVSAAGYTRNNPDGAAYPVLYVQADPIEAGDIQDLVVEISNDGVAWRSAGQALPSRNPRGDYRAVQGGEALHVRAQWRTSDGWRSAWVQTVGTVAIPAGSIATDTRNVGGLPVAGVVTTLGQIPDLAAGLSAAEGLIADAELAITEAQGDVDAILLRLDTPTTGIVARLTATELSITTPTTGLAARLTATEAAINTPTTGLLAVNAAQQQSIVDLNLGKAEASTVNALVVSARLGDAANLPFDFQNDGATWSSGWSGTPATRAVLAADAVYSFPVVAGVGKVIQIATAGANRDVSTIGAMPVRSGRRYRMTGRVRVLSPVVGAPTVGYYFIGLTADYVAVTTPGTDTATLVANTWTPIAYEYSGDELLALNAAVAFVRPMFRANGPSGANTFQFQFIRLEDVTDVKALDARVVSTETGITNLSASKADATRVALVEARAAGLAGSVNGNTGFDEWPVDVSRPTLWGGWDGGLELTSRVPDGIGGYALRQASLAGNQSGLVQYTPVGSGQPDKWFVLETEVELDAGTLLGAGVLVTYWDNAVATYRGETNVYFPNPDVDGVVVGNGVVGRRYRHSTMFKTPATGNDVSRFLVYPMAHWSGFGGSIAGANAVIFREVRVRRATADEIEQRTARGAFANLSARYSAVEQATVDLEAGKASVARVATLEARAGGANLLNKSQFKAPGGGYGTPADYAPWAYGGDMALEAVGIYGWSSDWAPLGENPLVSVASGSGSYMDWVSQKVAVEPGKRYCASVYSGLYNFPGAGYSRVFIEWLNEAGGIVGYSDLSGESYHNTSDGSFPGGKSLSAFKRIRDFGIAPAGASTGRVYLRRSQGGYNAYVWFTRPMLSEVSATAQVAPPWTPAALEARVATAELAVSTLEGRVEASSTLLVTAGNRVSGVRFLAVDGPDASYSSVDFLADVFRVWSPEQTTGVAPFEIRGGVVRMRDAIVDRLAIGASISVGSRRLALAFQPFSIQVTDGVPITYGGPSIGLAPDLVFLRDGAIQQPAAGESFNFYAETSTGTGFTPRLKLTTAGTPTNRTQGPGGHNADGTASHYYTLLGAAASNVVNVRAVGVIQSEFFNEGYSGGGGPIEVDDGTSYSDGFLTIAVFGYAGGWTRIGTLYVSPGFRSSYSDPPGIYNDAFDTGLQAMPVTPSTTHVGIAIEYESHAGSYISTLALAYQTAGSSGTRSATPNGELTTVMVYPKNSL